MKTLVATTAQAFWGPQAAAFATAMRNEGVDAEAISLRSLQSSGNTHCDVLFCIGSGESLMPFFSAISFRAKILYLIESVPTPTESDDFTRFKLSVHREYLKEFDHVFVHTSRSTPVLRSLGARRVETLTWPHFPSIFQVCRSEDQDIDVLFLGTLTAHRQWVLYKAATRFRVTNVSNIFHERSGPLYGRAKIALNIHATPLRNFECRVSEVLGCGAFLLTEELDPPDLLMAGRHLAVFEEANLLDQIAYYLEHAEERTEIARAGHAEIQRYSLEQQVKRIVQLMRELESQAN